jgi:pyruvate,water dikinase
MKYVKVFEEVGIQDIATVGGKNASIGEMIQHLAPQGIALPSGFALTADAYRLYLEENKLTQTIKDLLSGVLEDNIPLLQERGEKIRKAIYAGSIPSAVKDDIVQGYKDLEKRYGSNCDVACRSSATAEDLPSASFAGQQDTYLNISGVDAVLDAIKKAYASLFTDRAISYRIHQGFDHMDVALSVGVQKMVRSDLASSGVIFTLDTETGFRNVVYITSTYGLGEMIVQGKIDPDEFYVHKETLKAGFKPLLKKRLGSKNKKMVYSKSETIVVDTPLEAQKQSSLTDDEILELARQACVIEDYYSAQKGSWCPMDIEWAKDGQSGKLFIVQARPETVHSLKKNQSVLEQFIIDKDAAAHVKVLASGKSVGTKIASGVARIITSSRDMQSLKPGEILVTDMTDPDWEPIMKRAGAIITNRGGRTCHAAIVARELGIPAIVGTGNATGVIAEGSSITVDCSGGEVGLIYAGAIAFKREDLVLDALPSAPVHIMLNSGSPDEAFKAALLPSDGVGLARLEFIINASIQVHPLALVHFDKVSDKQARARIEELTHNYKDKSQFFVDTLAQEAGTLVAAFYPRPVIVRLSDFKSNEYRNLFGGDAFEPDEENPMIGFRGASRYYHERYREAFALECAAMKKIREVMGLKNLKLMIPFVRTLAEARTVIALMKEHGLVQGQDGLEIIMMCEIPSNVMLIEEFADIFDGFSIGSNDLTQLTLAVDRDSELVASIFDERDPAVKKMLSMAIAGARRKGKPIGICGQAPSDYPEIAQFLVEQGINSMSLNADSVVKVRLALAKK